MFVKNKLLRLPEFFVEGLFGFGAGWQVLANGTGASLTITRKAYEMRCTVRNKSSDDCIGVISRDAVTGTFFANSLIVLGVMEGSSHDVTNRNRSINS